MRLVVSATGVDGHSIGPLQLDPAGEGQGFYSTGPILTPGDWRVTVRAPAPFTSEATVAVRAKAAQTPPPARAESAPAAAPSSWPVWLIVLVVLAAAVSVALLLALARRVRRRPG